MNRILPHSFRARRLGAVLTLIGIFLLLRAPAAAQLNGTYSVGGSGANYQSIESAVAALQGAGVSGAVTFLINGGTYMPPTGGYRLTAITGMSASSTVTFKPAAGATVMITGATTFGRGIFTIDGGRYFVIDGSNTAGGEGRNMTVRQTDTSYNPAVMIRNNGDFNVVKNCMLQSDARLVTTNGGYFDTTASQYIFGSGVVLIGQTNGTSGNDSNTVLNNVIGDPAGRYRCNIGVMMTGATPSGTPLINYGNRIIGNDIVNFGGAPSYIERIVPAYGIATLNYNSGFVVRDNLIHMTQPSPYLTTYGIYLGESSAGSGNVTVSGNKIYRLSGTPFASTPANSPLATPPAQFQTIYGIAFFGAQGTQSSTFSNNMISLTASGPVEQYNFYFSGGGSNTVVNNSVYSGGIATGTYRTYMFYRVGTPSITHRNNVYYSTRSGGEGQHFGLFVQSASSWNASDYNLISMNGGANYYTAYYSGNKALLADLQTATGQDAHSVGGNPRFIDPANGDLHISPSARTAVEGRGTPLAALTADIDGQTRSTTAPDLGADEGTFTATADDDMAADRIEAPVDGAVLRSGMQFTPAAVFYNAGTNARSSVAVRLRIRDASGGVVYNDVQTIATLAPLRIQRVAFAQSGGVSGSTALPAGVYTIEIRAELAGDRDASNDVVSGTIVVKDPMSGTYTIDPNGSGSRNYGSFTAAAIDLNARGMTSAASDSAVIFRIAAGTYDQTTETFPIVLGAVTGAGAQRQVTFKPMAGATVILSGSNVLGPIVDVNQGDYYLFDGSNTVAGTSRDWTIVNTNVNPAIRFINGATYNTVKNMKLMADNPAAFQTISSNSGVLLFSNGGGNSNNTILNNLIGDPDGLIRSAIGIYSFGAAGNPNANLLIQGNEIVNFGNGKYSGYGLDPVSSLTMPGNNGYGIAVSNNTGPVKIIGNVINAPRNPLPPKVYTEIFGIFDLGSANSSGADTIAYNSITNLAYAPVPGGGKRYGIVTSGLPANKVIVAHNNVINFVGITALGAVGVEARSGQAGSILYVEHNTVNIGGTYARSVNVAYNNSAMSLRLRNNVLSNYAAVPADPTSSCDLIVVPTGTLVNGATLISDHNVLYPVIPETGSPRINTDFTYAAWVGRGWDAHSFVAPVPYVDAARGDLHIDQRLIFSGDNMGMPLGYRDDFDRRQRDTAAPDPGAYEGSYNGDGLRVLYPNGGERIPMAYPLEMHFAANRNLNVVIDFSTDDGRTWSRIGSTRRAGTGENISVITTPEVVTDHARIRVINTGNQWESDTSDREFSLFAPIIHLTAPIGRESFVGLDTTVITWTSESVLPSMRLQLDYSIDGGVTWLPIKTDIVPANLPAIYSHVWIVPNTPSERALVRVKLIGSTINDASQVFTILSAPTLTLEHPNAGDHQYVGGTGTIRWTSSRTDFLRLEYSIDRGGSWTPIINRLPAFLGSFDWKIPDRPAAEALVRIVNLERPQINAISSGPFSILKPTVTILSPNGSEQYELSRPVTVTWRQTDIRQLRLEYSSDYGGTWTTMMESIPAASGRASFTPPAVWTRLALVRLTDVDHSWISDYSDRPFELLPPKGIVIFTPAVGDRLIRRSTAIVNWRADRIGSVDLEYSLDNGATWATMASDVDAGSGSYVWQVPDVTTRQGRIRISEAGGDAIVERSWFEIVDATAPVVTVIRPNGGELYVKGEKIQVQWSATSDVAQVRLSYSPDDGATWTPIAGPLPAGQGMYPWTVDLPAGSRYRVKADGGVATDISDGPFGVTAAQNPSITVTYPNGGEQLEIGASEQVRWTSVDVAGPVLVDYSVDGGGAWIPLGSAAAAAGTIAFPVPDAATDNGLVRVTAASTIAGDLSDAPFTIKARAKEPLRVVLPNTGSEIWYSGSTETIVWESPADVSQVVISYSLDGGTSWREIATVASVPGANTYRWPVVLVGTEMNRASIRVTSVTETGRSDASDMPFTIRPPSTAGVADEPVASTSLSVTGAMPNPCQTGTTIGWWQPEAGEVSYRVVDELGSMVRSGRAAGRAREANRLYMPMEDLPSGVYYYRIRMNGTECGGTIVVSR